MNQIQLPRIGDQLQQMNKRVQQQIKKSMKQIAIDELNILSDSLSVGGSSSGAEKKAKQTLKKLQEINNQIMLILWEQDQCWDRLFKRIVDGFLNLANRVLQQWGGLLSGLQKSWTTTTEFLGQIWQQIYNGVIKPIWDSIAQLLSRLWNEHFYPLYQRFGELMQSLGLLFQGLWNNYIFPFLQNLSNVFSPLLKGVLESVGNGFYNLMATIADFANGGILSLQGILEFLSGVFTGNWQRAWSGIEMIFRGTWESIFSLGKGIINGLISAINGFLKGMEYGMNAVIGAINSIKINIPKWVPVFGGSSLGFHLPKVSMPQIPMLAKGGVIRQPTLAMLGEYSGAGADPEIAAPQSLLKKTMAEEISQLAPLLQSMIGLLQEQNRLQQQKVTTVVLDGEQLYQNHEKHRLAKGYPIGLNPAFR